MSNRTYGRTNNCPFCFLNTSLKEKHIVRILFLYWPLTPLISFRGSKVQNRFWLMTISWAKGSPRPFIIHPSSYFQPICKMQWGQPSSWWGVCCGWRDRDLWGVAEFGEVCQGGEMGWRRITYGVSTAGKATKQGSWIPPNSTLRHGAAKQCSSKQDSGM